MCEEEETITGLDIQQLKIESKCLSRIAPIWKQCFVTLGASLNMSNLGTSAGFAAIVLSQLTTPASEIYLDIDTGSWFASVNGFTQIVGSILAAPVMSKFGRRPTNLTSLLLLLTSWLWLILSRTVVSLLLARVLQGFSLGMAAAVCPVLIGEYTSPRNRGAFLSSVGISMTMGVLFVHTIGSFASWKITGLVFACTTFANILVVFFSPESPSWLINEGRYEEGMEVFRWLRGNNEEEELISMIEANILLKNAKVRQPRSFSGKLKGFFSYCSSTIRKKEFYKPMLIMIHMYGILHWGGINTLSSYTYDLVNQIVTEPNARVIVISLSAQRLVSNLVAVFIIKKVKRRTMLFSTGCLNVFVLVSTALYTYCKEIKALPFDHQFIGVLLLHLHIFCLAIGLVLLPYMLAGEMFPLEYRSLSGSLSIIFFSLLFIGNVKTYPLMTKAIGLWGSFGVYGVMITYALGVLWVLLPETKDKTLQEIEDEFRGVKRGQKSRQL